MGYIVVWMSRDSFKKNQNLYSSKHNFSMPANELIFASNKYNMNTLAYSIRINGIRYSSDDLRKHPNVTFCGSVQGSSLIQKRILNQ